jgi:hypothetical protein
MTNALRFLAALTVTVLRWTWRATLVLFALTVTAAAAIGITAAVRHRRARHTPAAIETHTMRLPVITAAPARGLDRPQRVARHRA